MSVEKLLRAKDVAELLDVKPATIYQWRWLGEGPPAVTINGRVRFRLSDVETWLAAQQTDDRRRDRQTA